MSRRALRVTFIAVALVAALGAGCAITNIASITAYNAATAQLRTDLAESRKPAADIAGLNARQEQTDAQFAEAGTARPILLPSVRRAIDTNSAISAQLTKRLRRELDERRDGGTNHDGKAKRNPTTKSGGGNKQPGLSDEQRKQVEDLLKANRQSTDTNTDAATGNRAGNATTTHNTGKTAKPW